MKTQLTSLALAGCVLAAALVFAFNLRANEPAVARVAEHANGLLIERGRYLVDHVGLCADCHTPRGEKGELLSALWLQGAPIGFAPKFPMPWAEAAPPIAGLPSMNDEQALVVLTTGVRPDGSNPRPPMPPYRFSESDARAVIAYLRTLDR